MRLNDASRVIAVIDERINLKTKSEARVETTWGTVAGVSSDRKTVSAYLYGETESAYVSTDIRVLGGIVPNVGDSIKVALDKARGDRWVEQVHHSNAYQRIEFDIQDGEVRLGGGAAAPDTRLYRSATKKITLDDGAGGAATLDVIGSLKENGVDVATMGDIPSVPSASGSVSSETSYGLSATAGAASTYSRGDHSHGSPALPTQSGAGFTVPSGDLAVSAGKVTSERLRLTATDDVTLASTLHGLQVGPDAGANLVMDVNEIQARNNGAADTLYLNNEGGRIILGGGSHGFAQGGTSFPSSPTVNDHFYRTDRDLWFFWDGTRWLSEQLFHLYIYPDPAAAFPATATKAAFLRAPLPVATNFGTDIWLEQIWFGFFVTTGATALGASHKWDIDTEVLPVGTVIESTASIASGSSGVWRLINAIDIDALLGANFELEVNVTKTGTPGNLYLYGTLAYRIVG